MVIEILHVVILTAAALICAAMGLLALECVAALLPARQPKAPAAKPGTIGVLVPAHDEALVIDATLQSIMAQLNPEDRIWVVADNCTDDTAQIAAAAGATVLERVDPVRRGKGFALEFGLQVIAPQHPDILIICDADIIAEPGAIRHLAEAAATTGQPAQAAYLMVAPGSASPAQLLSQLAFTVKNLIRPLGLKQFGMPGPLSGTGMAFPWSVLQSVKMDTGSIVEDLQLAIDMRLAGFRPVFCPEARVISTFPDESAAAHGQRKRWEHGHLQVILTQVPRLLLAALRQRSFSLLVAAAEISVPPLALLILLWGAVLAVAAGFGLWTNDWQPALFLAGTGVVLMVTLFAALRKFSPRETLGRSFRAVPQYVLKKIPLYASFLFSRETAWVRTDRGTLNADSGAEVA